LADFEESVFGCGGVAEVSAVGEAAVAGAFCASEFAFSACALRLRGSARITATRTTARDFMTFTPAALEALFLNY
jgi:hypothetical protein